MIPETKERLDLLKHMYADGESFDLNEVGFLLDTIDEINSGYEEAMLLNDKLKRRLLKKCDDKDKQEVSMSENKSALEPITETLIAAAVAYLQTRMAQHAKAVDLTANAKRELEISVANATVQGLITGKNESERDARSMMMFMPQIAALDGCDKNEREARLDAELARLDLEAIKLRLRLLELAKIKD